MTIDDRYNNVTHYKIFSINGAANLLVGTTLFSLFLGIFYFTYASKIENDILSIQIKNLIDNLTGDLNNLNLDENTKNQLKDAINIKNKPDLSDEDKNVKDTNKKIIIKTSKIFGSFLFISTFIIILLYFTTKIDIKSILITNIILLIFVAIAEVLFLNLVAKNYRSLDPNVVKQNIVKQILNLKNIN